MCTAKLPRLINETETLGTHDLLSSQLFAGYRANLAAAGDSDARLLKRLQENASQLMSLSIDAAVSQMPRLQVCFSLPFSRFRSIARFRYYISSL